MFATLRERCVQAAALDKSIWTNLKVLEYGG